MKTIKASDLHARRMANDPAYRDAYEALGEEFDLVSALLAARANAGLTQAEIAARMGTTESAISRLESGRVKPSTRTLEKYARATGCRLTIRLDPLGAAAE